MLPKQIPRFIFRCRNCGEYPVTRGTFRKFVPENKWEELQQKIKKGAWGGLIEFDKECPKCTPEGKSTGVIKILHPKPKGGKV